MPLAPVVAFAFNRPRHAREMLASLNANPEAERTDVFVFCDGPRGEQDVPAVAETRDVVRRCGLPRLTLIERERNHGLAASVIEGVTTLCRERSEVIVLEDDLVLSPGFLAYMNAALSRYRDEPKVHAISGFMYPIELPRGTDAAFLPFVSSWGWATWERAWKAFDPAAAGYDALRRSWRLRRRFDLFGSYPYFALLEAQRRGEIDSWAVRWYLSVFGRGGVSLFPATSLVENRGFGSGTHCAGGEAPPSARSKAAPFAVQRWPEPVVDEAAFRQVRRLLAREYGGLARLQAQTLRSLRRLLPQRSE